ncbi:hypothetical protein BBJ28_00018096 [Nothophytophthora sp. Chile5]|nr:hypothetical protein BBJ28_00018096 [Nothophytophthora sp. Chile5]
MEVALLKDKKYYEDVVYPHLRWMHDARIRQQFEALVDLFVSKWKEDEESEYAQWFEDVYVAAPWGSWFVGVAGEAAGILPSQDPLESVHRTIASDYFVRAKTILIERQNFMRLRRPNSRELRAVVFNATDYMVNAFKASSGLQVTAARVKHTAALNGKLVAGNPAADAPRLYLSLHAVEIIRSGYMCDCTGFRQSGWICEHIITTLALLDKLSLDGALRTLPVRQPPGRPSKPRGALARDSSDDHFFSVENLTRILTKTPGSCLHWSIMHEFAFIEDGVTTKEYQVGRIVGWHKNDGRYAWSVRFATLGLEHCKHHRR